MSDDDLIRRGDAIEALCGRMDREEYGHAKAAVALDIEAIRSLPASPSPAERLARAVDEMEDECCGAGIPQYLAANGWTDSEAAFLRMLSALDAYRAAKPPVSDGKSDSTGAAPPAAEPAPFQKPPGSLDEAAVRGNNPEPAKHEHREDTLTTVGNRHGAPCGKCKRGAVNISDGKCRLCGSQEQAPCPSCRPGGAA